jgi:hypothetical protein
MSDAEKLEYLIEQAAALPDDALKELFQSLIEMHADQLGIYDPVDPQS